MLRPVLRGDDNADHGSSLSAGGCFSPSFNEGFHKKETSNSFAFSEDRKRRWRRGSRCILFAHVGEIVVEGFIIGIVSFIDEGVFGMNRPAPSQPR